MAPSSPSTGLVTASAASTAASGTSRSATPAPAPATWGSDQTVPQAQAQDQAHDETDPANRTVRIVWGGDAVPASSSIALPNDPGVLLGGVAPVLRAADVAIVNLEGQLTARGTSKCTRMASRNCYAFRSPTSYGRDVFAAAGVDVLAVANNHSYDYGDEGRADTFAAIEQAGLARTGVDNDIAYLDRNGLRVAVLSFAPYGFTSDYRDEPTYTATVRRAAANADLVVVALHLGAEGGDKQHTPDAVERAFGENRGNPRRAAHLAVDAGADLVVAAGPHTVRGVEAYRGRVIAYSTGNLVGYAGALQAGGNLSMSALLDVRLRGDGTMAEGQLHSLWIDGRGIPAADPSGRTVKRMAELSRDDFGTRAVTIGPDGRLTLPR